MIMRIHQQLLVYLLHHHLTFWVNCLVELINWATIFILILGGETITITGTNFNTSMNQVFFGDKAVVVVSYTSTQIVVKSPSMNPGIYKLNIPSGPSGNAK